MAQQPPDPTADGAAEDASDKIADGDDILVVELIPEPPDAPVIRLIGELDVSSVDHVRAATAKAISEGARRLVFDLRGLEFIDSSGITVLLAAVSQVDSVLIRQPSAAARRIIETTGLAGVLRFEP